MYGQNCSLQGDSKDLKHGQVVVVMVPFPAYGHMNQLLHLSHLITSFQIEVHCVGFTFHNDQAKLRVSNAETIHFHDFQIPLFRKNPPNPDTSIHFPPHFKQISDSVSYLRRPVFRLLLELSTKFRRIIVIHDNLMASVVRDVKLVSKAESYTFLSVSAFTIFFSKWESIIEKPFQLDPDVPTCIPAREGCFTPEFEEFIIRQHKLLEFESGRLFNTSRLIEGRYIELLAKLSTSANKKLFAIGPFNPVELKGTNKGTRHRCLEWLDRQENNSVIYVSFGTVTSMKDDQIRELTTGLERSGLKFIWVLRNPDNGNFSREHKSRSALLPKGYEKRVQNRGMVEREWAPQLEILEHPATGGFISHCGWSSSMESITMGVPIIAWPMHSDQPKNSILVTEVLRIGILIRNWEKRADLVTSDSIENAIRRLMLSEDGQEMRKRAVDLGSDVRGSVSNGGVSRLELESFIAHITR
ncbi:hypothetical protein vseg_007689 [Gypsophila vaccaria]